MKKKIILFSILSVFAYNCNVVAQEEEDTEFKEVTELRDTPVLRHKVQLGETVVMIARKYMVKPQDIYEINPDAVDGLKPNMLLKIPADKIKAQLKPEQKSAIRTEQIAVVKKYD